MELRTLRAFVAVARHKSFTQGAEELFLTQSAVSQQIRALEECLGTTLFVRERNSVELTAAGRTLLPRAEAIVSLAAQTQTHFSANNALRGRLVLVAATVASSYLYVGLYERFARLHPHVDIVITTGVGAAAATARVADGEADAAFVQLPMPDERLQHDVLGETELLLVAQAEHPIHDRRSVKFEALPGPLVIWDGSRELDARLATTKLRIGVRSNDLALLKRLLAEGRGIAFLPQWAVREELAAGTFRAINLVGTPIRQRFGIAYRAAERSPVLVSFLSLAHDYRTVVADLTRHSGPPAAGANRRLMQATPGSQS
jgi:DNA-binding transcriptional LysR family regulator